MSLGKKTCQTKNQYFEAYWATRDNKVGGGVMGIQFKDQPCSPTKKCRSGCQCTAGKCADLSSKRGSCKSKERYKGENCNGANVRCISGCRCKKAPGASFLGGEKVCTGGTSCIVNPNPTAVTAQITAKPVVSYNEGAKISGQKTYKYAGTACTVGNAGECFPSCGCNPTTNKCAQRYGQNIIKCPADKGEAASLVIGGITFA
eukprot:306182_1